MRKVLFYLDPVDEMDVNFVNSPDEDRLVIIFNCPKCNTSISISHSKEVPRWVHGESCHRRTSMGEEVLNTYVDICPWVSGKKAYRVAISGTTWGTRGYDIFICT